jgi:hypothetical protein
MRFRPFLVVLGSYRGSKQLEEFNQIKSEGHSTIPGEVTKGGSLSL